MYPTEAEIEAIQDFKGTVPEFFDYVESLFGMGVVRRSEGAEGHIITLITCGWSGCEEIVSEFNRTLLGILTHSKWERGGLFEYRVSHEMWAWTEEAWGNPTRVKG